MTLYDSGISICMWHHHIWRRTIPTWILSIDQLHDSIRLNDEPTLKITFASTSVLSNNTISRESFLPVKFQVGLRGDTVHHFRLHIENYFVIL